MMNCAVNLIFEGSLRTNFSFVFSGNSKKLFGKLILLSQRSLSVLYAGQ